MLGGIVGLLWGATVGEEIDGNAVGGAIAGGTIGLIGGKILGELLPVAVRLLILIAQSLSLLAWVGRLAGQ